MLMLPRKVQYGSMKVMFYQQHVFLLGGHRQGGKYCHVSSVVICLWICVQKRQTVGRRVKLRVITSGWASVCPDSLQKTEGMYW